MIIVEAQMSPKLIIEKVQINKIVKLITGGEFTDC